MAVFDHLPVTELGLSVRSLNVLRRNRILTLGALMECTSEDLSRFRNLGQKSLKEIMDLIAHYKSLEEDILAGKMPVPDPDKPASPEKPVIPEKTEEERIFSALEEGQFTIDELPSLSPRAYNLLLFSSLKELHQVARMDHEALMQIRGMNEANAKEISNACRAYIDAHKEELLQRASEKESLPSLKELLYYEPCKEKILSFVKANDVSLHSLYLPARALHIFDHKNLQMMSDIIFLTKEDFLKMKNMGVTTLKEILRVKDEYLKTYEEQLLAVCSGDWDAAGFAPVDSVPQVSDDTIREEILALYKTAAFVGLSLQDFREKIAERITVTDEDLKRNIGALLAAGELEYADYRCYRVYPKFTDVLLECPKLDDRQKDVILRRLNKETLESIGQDYGLTRERVRQLAEKAFRTFQSWNAHSNKLSWFDEDYYRYFFTSYAFETKDAEEWLGIPSYVFIYFDMLGEKQGKKPLTDALEDVSGIDAGLRLKIRNYLNRVNLFIDGRWIPLRRGELEEIVAEKFCKNEVSFSDFAGIYNRFLEQEEVPYNEKVYYTDDVIRTRYNRLAEARFLLWKQGSMLRYYDIDARDYTELLDELSLDSYENVEISSAKLFRDHPDIMRRYDIRDKYELHNLLKKIVPKGSYHGIEFKKNPTILFGTFDRDEAVRRILFENAPVSVQDLVKRIEDEYGYEPATTLGSYLACIDRYKTGDIYVVDQKPIDSPRMAALQAVLPDDFYYTEEIAKKYLELFPDADIEEITPFNLKLMGFSVYTGYVVRNSNAYQYFQNLLTEQDITDTRAYMNRYGRIVLSNQVLWDLKRDLQIIEFEPGRVLHFRRLEAAGITREIIEEFCDAVWDFADDSTYFTAASLRQDGFESPLYDLGFSDWFYGSLLISDPRFSYSRAFGNLVFYKGAMDITKKSFICDRIREHRTIDRFDLLDELENRYGCPGVDRSHLVEDTKNTEVHYDPYLDRFYADEEIFYRALEAREAGK